MNGEAKCLNPFPDMALVTTYCNEDVFPLHSPLWKEKIVPNKTPNSKAEQRPGKRKLNSPGDISDDEDKKVTPKRRRSLILCEGSPTTPAKPKTPCSMTRLTVPLSERQQVALLKQMTAEESHQTCDSHLQSPQPLSPQSQVKKKLNKRNERGETSLHIAAKKGDVKQTKKLIKNGADINVKDYAGWTPLHEACNRGWVDVAKQLLKAGANVNVQGLENDMPLHDAASNGHCKLVQLLLRHGANPLQVNQKGVSPLDIAANDDVVKLLHNEIIASSSSCSSSSLDEVRSPTSPESNLSDKELHKHSSRHHESSSHKHQSGSPLSAVATSHNDESHSYPMDSTEPISSPTSQTTSAFPLSTNVGGVLRKVHVSHHMDSPSSPRLMLKFHHVRQKENIQRVDQGSDSPGQLSDIKYKKYSVSVETDPHSRTRLSDDGYSRQKTVTPSKDTAASKSDFPVGENTVINRQADSHKAVVGSDDRRPPSVAEQHHSSQPSRDNPSQVSKPVSNNVSRTCSPQFEDISDAEEEQSCEGSSTTTPMFGLAGVPHIPVTSLYRHSQPSYLDYIPQHSGLYPSQMMYNTGQNPLSGLSYRQALSWTGSGFNGAKPAMGLTSYALAMSMRHAYPSIPIASQIKSSVKLEPISVDTSDNAALVTTARDESKRSETPGLAESRLSSEVLGGGGSLKMRIKSEVLSPTTFVSTTCTKALTSSDGEISNDRQSNATKTLDSENNRVLDETDFKPEKSSVPTCIATTPVEVKSEPVHCDEFKREDIVEAECSAKVELDDIRSKSVGSQNAESMTTDPTSAESLDRRSPAERTSYSPKVPPLKIIMPSSKGCEKDVVRTKAPSVKTSLPYVVNLPQNGDQASEVQKERSTETENSTESLQLSVEPVVNRLDTKDETTSLQSDIPAHRRKKFRHSDKPEKDKSSDTETDVLTEKTATRDTESQRDECTNHLATSVTTTTTNTERRLTRAAFRSQQQQQQKTQGSAEGSAAKKEPSIVSEVEKDIKDATTTGSKMSDDIDEDQSLTPTVTPASRKHKLKHKIQHDAALAENLIPYVPPLKKPPNPYELYLNIRKKMFARRERWCQVTPKPPDGFTGYLMVKRTYALHQSAKDDLAAPVTPPSGLATSLLDVFTQQETTRRRLRLQHKKEWEKLRLSLEQELLRVKCRSARALASQTMPLSLCSLLREEDLYNSFDLHQDEKDKRSRYNGRQLVSWIDDVKVKFERLKNDMCMRHLHEVESLHAIQRLEWEWKMKEAGLCDHHSDPVISDQYVPMVAVLEEFSSFPT